MAWQRAFAKVVAGAASVKRQFSRRDRRSWAGTSRAHVELRDVKGAERAVLERTVAADLKALTGVQHVRFNHATGRVVVDFDAGGPSVDEIIATVEHAEETAGFRGARFRDTEWQHPADFEAAERLLIALCAEAVGVATGTALRFSLLPASRVAGTLASLLQILQTSPRLRRGFDERFGPLRAELALGVGAALAHGVAQRPGSALVELTHRAVQLA